MATYDEDQRQPQTVIYRPGVASPVTPAGPIQSYAESLGATGPEPQRQPQIVPNPSTVGGLSPRTPDAVLAPVQPVVRPSSGVAPLTPNDIAATYAGNTAPGNVAGASPRTPDAAAAAYAASLQQPPVVQPVQRAAVSPSVTGPAIGAGGNLAVDPSVTPGAYARDVITRGIPTIGRAIGDAVGYFAGAAGDASRRVGGGVFGPMFQFAEQFNGAPLPDLPTIAPVATAAEPAKPTATTATTPAKTSPVGERSVPLTTTPGPISTALANAGLTPQDVAGARPFEAGSRSLPTNPGTYRVTGDANLAPDTYMKIGDDGRRHLVVAGAQPAQQAAPQSAQPTAQAAQASGNAQSANEGSVVRAGYGGANVISAIQRMLADEEDRLASMPRYVGGVGPGYSMSAADAAAANAAILRDSAARRASILQFGASLANTAAVNDRTAIDDANSVATRNETRARADRERAQTETEKERTKGIITQEAQRQEELTLQRKLAETTDPKERATLERKLAGFRGRVQQEPRFQIATQKGVDATGFPVETSYVVSRDQDGNPVVRPITAVQQQPNATQQFIEGKTYTDAKGNKATYRNGKFEPAK